MARLKEIIDYSKANPESDYAKRAYFLIQEGQFDDQAALEGVDLSWARPSVPQAPVDERTTFSNIGQKIGASLKESGENVMRGFEQTAEDVEGVGVGPLSVAAGVGQNIGILGGETIKAVFDTILKTMGASINALGGNTQQAKESFLAGTNILGETNEETLQKLSQYIEEAEVPKSMKTAIENLLMTVGLTGLGALSRPVGKIPTISEASGPTVTKTTERVVAGATETARETALVARNPVETFRGWFDKLQAREVDSLEQVYREIAGTTQMTRRVLRRSDKRTGALERAGTTGQAPERILAEHAIIPEQSAGRLNTIEQAKSFRIQLQPLYKTNRAALLEVELSTEPIKLSLVRERAIQLAKSEQNINRGEAESMVREVNKAFDAYDRAFGESIRITNLDDIKSARWGDTKFDSTKPLKGDVNYVIGRAAKELVEETAEKAGASDVAQLNRVIGDRLEVAQFLEKLDGKVVKGGRLGRYVLATIGSTVGHTLPGKVLGAIGGDMVAQMLISNAIADPVKRLILRQIRIKDPEAYQQTLSWLEKENVARGTRALLPEGLPAGAGATVNQGRAIPVLPKEFKGDYVGPESAVAQSTPALPKVAQGDRGFLDAEAMLKAENEKLFQQFENARILKEKGPPKAGAIEALSEKAIGFRAGDKVIFDTFIREKNAGGIFEMIKEGRVPQEYLKSFSKEIDEILGPRIHEVGK